RSNLGTFGKVNDEPYDLILINPPYVTSGSSSLKRSIDEEGLATYYTSNGRGTEALAMEWIVRNLKPEGQAIVVVPDGLLNQESMLEYLKTHCFIEGVVSLPTRTFYSTPKKTYIICLRKKADINEQQR
ncbi:N-6 DNA methylase, partial [Escherichia coli]